MSSHWSKQVPSNFKLKESEGGPISMNAEELQLNNRWVGHGPRMLIVLQSFNVSLLLRLSTWLEFFWLFSLNKKSWLKVASNFACQNNNALLNP